MFIYNVFPSSFVITALQGIIVFVLLISSFILALVLTKKKPDKKIVVASVVIGILLTVLSLSIGNGIESGFASKMGWPIYFLRNVQGVDLTDLSFIIDSKNHWYFLIERFILNSLLFILPFLNLSWFFSLRKTVKSLKIHILPLLTLFALLVLSVFCLNNVLEKSTSNFSSLKLPDDDTEQKREPFARNLIETQYPEFKDFENQKSFAGNSVFVQSTTDSIYFAYVVNGSGVSFVDGTCFKVDSKNIVSKIGKLIVANSSTGRVDPKSCSEEKN
jgi:hypothetical protein